MQTRLAAAYGLELDLDVRDFVRCAPRGGRERLLLREGGEDLEVALELPGDSVDDTRPWWAPHDGALQIVEGVSHFVKVAERARRALPTTHLELELQAEVDKFVIFGVGRGAGAAEIGALHRTLFEEVVFLHEPDTEPGRLYRLAHRLAARCCRWLGEQRPHHCWRWLRRFYGEGQTGKLSMALSA